MGADVERQDLGEVLMVEWQVPTEKGVKCRGTFKQSQVSLELSMVAEPQYVRYMV